MIIFNITSAEIKTKSADVCIIENEHNFERNEDHTAVFFKWTDFTQTSTFYILHTVFPQIVSALE